jgi:hypothetical protein
MTDAAKAVVSVNQDYAHDGAAPVTVAEKADTYADRFVGAGLKGQADTPVALGDSFHNTQYESGSVKGIDDIGADDNGAIGLTAVGIVTITAPTVASGQTVVAWSGTTKPQDFDETGGRVRIVVYNDEAVPQTPDGSDRDSARGLQIADGTYISGVGGAVHESTTAVATGTKTVTGLTNAQVYAVGVRLEMPSGDANQAGGQAYSLGPWSWYSASPVA